MKETDFSKKSLLVPSYWIFCSFDLKSLLFLNYLLTKSFQKLTGSPFSSRNINFLGFDGSSVGSDLFYDFSVIISISFYLLALILVWWS